MQTNQTSPSNISRYNGKIPKNAPTSLRRIIRKQRNSYRRKEDKRAVLESIAIIHEENIDRLKKEIENKTFYSFYEESRFFKIAYLLDVSPYNEICKDQQFSCSTKKNGYNHFATQILKAPLIEIEGHSLYLKYFI